MLDASLHYSLDYDLWIRLARLVPMEKLDTFLATSRIHPHSKTMSQMGPAMSETIRTPAAPYFGYCSMQLAVWILPSLTHRTVACAGAAEAFGAERQPGHCVGCSL